MHRNRRRNDPLGAAVGRPVGHRLPPVTNRAAAAPRKSRATIKDVAETAGVSRGTVSRVLNGGRYVSPEAFAAVNQAIRTTGYRTNHHARSLVTGKANSIAFVLTEPGQLLFENPIFGILLLACTRAAASRNLPVVLMVAGDPQELRRTTDYIAAGHVDGAVLVSTHAGNPLITALMAEGVPLVAAGAPLGFESALGYVEADEVGGARTMTRHLLGRGRTRIATITGPLDTSGGARRLEGYRLELGDAFDPTLVAHGDWSRASGKAAMLELLERRPDIDAVFAASDLMADGAMTVLAESGRRVPEDVAVGGFDDFGLAATLDPPLTTMRQPLDRIAEEIVRLLLDVIDGRGRAAITLPVSLVVRSST